MAVRVGGALPAAYPDFSKVMDLSAQVRDQGLGFGVEGGGWRVWGLGWRVEGGGGRVEGRGWRVEGEGLRVEGRGCWSRLLPLSVSDDGKMAPSPSTSTAPPLLLHLYCSISVMMVDMAHDGQKIV